MKTCYLVPEARAIADLVELDGAPLFPDERVHLLTRINVPRAFRGRGHGRELLTRVLADADREGATLVLEISPSGGLAYEELEAWYRRRGFRPHPSGYFVRRVSS